MTPEQQATIEELKFTHKIEITEKGDNIVIDDDIIIFPNGWWRFAQEGGKGTDEGHVVFARGCTKDA